MNTATGSHVRHRGRRARLAVILLAGVLLGGQWSCVPFWGAKPASTSVEAALLELVAQWPADGETTLLGFRETDGSLSAGAAALDELLLSAVVRAGHGVHPDAGIAGTAGGDGEGGAGSGLWPPGWRRQPGPWVAAGQLRVDGDWAYLRLALADTATGIVRRDDRSRIPVQDLTRLVQARQARLTEDRRDVLADLTLETHVVVRRDEGGFPRPVDWVEAAVLDEGDRLQLRLRVDEDCDLFVLLYRSDGETNVLYDGAVFGGRWIYVPGENAWQSLAQADLVYTLYVAAARRIEEDKASLWEDLSLLQQENRVEKFRGLNLVDAAVAEFLQRTASDTVVVVRGEAATRVGEVEHFVYGDGLVVDSVGRIATGTHIVRARSAEVRFR